jgi:hypothetical protein
MNENEFKVMFIETGISKNICEGCCFFNCDTYKCELPEKFPSCASTRRKDKLNGIFVIKQVD